VCLLFAVLAPWAVYVSHVRDVRRLRALEARGEQVTATVTQASADEGTLRYAYSFAGSRYTAAVSWPHVPYVAGESIVVYCLPDSPSMSLPGAMLSDAAVLAEAEPTFTLHLMADLLALFALAAVVADVERRRARPPDATTAARLVALVGLGVVLAANLGHYAMGVERRAFAGALPGVAAGVVAPFVEAALVAPFLWILPLLVAYRQAAGRTGPGLRHARPILLLGLGYGIVLLAALAAFTGGGKF
jgi:hypothetical protein